MAAIVVVLIGSMKPISNGVPVSLRFRAESNRVESKKQVGEFQIEPQINTIFVDDKSIRVEPKVMQVLICLIDGAGEVVTKQRLMQAVWGDTFVTDDVLTRSVSELRKAFRDDSKEPRYIQTIPKKGYRLIAHVSYDGVNVRSNGLRSTPSSDTSTTSLFASGSGTKRLAWGAIVLVVALVAVWFYVRNRTSERAVALVKVVPFTSFPGREDFAAFSPDGNQIAFVWGGEKSDNADIYVKSINGENPLRLTSDPAIDVRPTWSGDGQKIAFVRITPSEPTFSIFVVSALGTSTEHKLLSLTSDPGPISWSPDGKFIALSEAALSQERSGIVLFSLDTGEKRSLMSPPEQYWRDSNPAFSPDSKTLAFVREKSAIAGDIFVVPVAGGEPSRLTHDNARHSFGSAVYGGLAWTSDGREIIFSSTRGGTPSLWRVSVSGGDPERLPGGGDNTYFPSVSLLGSRLAYTQLFAGTPIYRIEIPASTLTAAAPIKLLESTRTDASPVYSPDGQRIAFTSDRSGNQEIWMCDAGGQKLTQLTFFGKGMAVNPQWSPGGDELVFDYRTTGDANVYVLDVRGGVPRRVTTESLDAGIPSWSKDGRYIYFTSNRSGEQQVWKVPVAGGEAVQVTRGGGFTVFESTDGAYIYYSKVDGPRGIWRVPVGGGEEELVLGEKHPGAGVWGSWCLAKDGLYLFNPNARTGCAVEFFSFATRRVTQVAHLEGVNEFLSGLTVSPDGRWLLYTQQNPISSDIMLVENFH
jgi:Tol biopolymer transport system component/DNA-binding winged helix-turn-helix (wHTH) protein